MPIDARIRYTKLAIKEAFLKLLKGKDVRKITVKEICKLAEIDRTTFYKYYKNQYDLMEQIEQEQLEELQKLLNYNKNDNIETNLKRMLDKIYNEIDTYSAIFSDNGDSKFSNKIFEVFYESVSKDLDAKFPKMPKEKQEWLYYFLSYGCSGILKCWIKDGKKKHTDELANYISDLTKIILNNNPINL